MSGRARSGRINAGTCAADSEANLANLIQSANQVRAPWRLNLGSRVSRTPAAERIRFGVVSSAAGAANDPEREEQQERHRRERKQEIGETGPGNAVIQAADDRVGAPGGTEAHAPVAEV